MINRIKQTVQDFLNTENRGNFQPEVFNRLLHNSVQECFEDLFYEANRIINRQNRGLINGGIENITDKIRERIQHYLQDGTMTYNVDHFTYPDDVRYFDGVFYNGEFVELCKSQKEFNILKSTNPTEEYPIGVKVGEKIKILPITITDNVTFSYLRNPIRAKWTYEVVNCAELYNPDANDFVDVDIHPSMEVDVTIKVLKAFGINLKEQDIQAITTRIEAESYNQENQS